MKPIYYGTVPSNLSEDVKKSYTLYIGSNNQTGILELTKIEPVLNYYFEAYTLLEAKGYWRAKAERTAIVQITTNKAFEVWKAIKELKEVLQQEAVGVLIGEPMELR